MLWIKTVAMARKIRSFAVLKHNTSPTARFLKHVVIQQEKHTGNTNVNSTSFSKRENENLIPANPQSTQYIDSHKRASFKAFVLLSDTERVFSQS